MDPVTIILGAAAIAGAIKGSERKYIDPIWLKENYGPMALTREAQELFAHYINSPAGMSIISAAAEGGQAFGRAMEAKAAAAGQTPMTGSSTGSSIFATSAGEGASNTAVNQARGAIYQSMFPIAQQNLDSRMQAILSDRAAGGVQTPQSAMWDKVGNAAGVALTATSTPKTPSTLGPLQSSSVVGPDIPIQPSPLINGATQKPYSLAGYATDPWSNQPRQSFWKKALRLGHNTSRRFVTT